MMFLDAGSAGAGGAYLTPYRVATASREILSVAFYPNLAPGTLSIVPVPKVIPALIAAKIWS